MLAGCSRKKEWLLACFFSIMCCALFSKNDSTLVIVFDFNEQAIKEKNNLIEPRAVGISLVKDRFGNDKSAIYLHGNPDSYLNLGTSDLLKPKAFSVSIWINLDRYIYAGQGSEANPIIGTKNGPTDDFNIAYGLCYDFKSGRLCALSHKDSTLDVNIKSIGNFVFNEWYHLVYTLDGSEFRFYVNGELQQKAIKRFEINYLADDSVVIGNTANKKNHRWLQGIIDDIQIHHRAITPGEVQALYRSDNPNKQKQFIADALKYLGLITVFVLIIIALLIRNKQNLKKQKKQLDLLNRINELEIKVIKNRMNPHFISNCLSAIQELIYTQNYTKAVQYIAKFSFFMRQGLHFSSRTYITLEEEIAIIQLNVELEQLRFKDKFEFKLNVSNVNLSEILIPSLITQPFIENAVWHGLLPLQDIRKGYLEILVYEKADSVYLEITDNGVGRNNKPLTPNSKGTKLVTDKIESINKLMGENNYRFEIIDRFDKQGKAAGTRIVIQLKNSRE